MILDVIVDKDEDVYPNIVYVCVCGRGGGIGQLTFVLDIVSHRLNVVILL